MPWALQASGGCIVRTSRPLPASKAQVLKIVHPFLLLQGNLWFTAAHSSSDLADICSSRVSSKISQLVELARREAFLTYFAPDSSLGNCTQKWNYLVYYLDSPRPLTQPSSLLKFLNPQGSAPTHKAFSFKIPQGNQLSSMTLSFKLTAELFLTFNIILQWWNGKRITFFERGDRWHSLK